MKFYLVECTCKENEPHVDGSKPYFYTDENKAAYMFKKLKYRVTYFGVHLNGLHITNIFYDK